MSEHSDFGCNFSMLIPSDLIINKSPTSNIRVLRFFVNLDGIKLIDTLFKTIKILNLFGINFLL